MTELTMDKALIRLKVLCHRQRATSVKIVEIARQLAEVSADLATQAHELANLTTIASGWDLLAKDDGVDLPE